MIENIQANKVSKEAISLLAVPGTEHGREQDIEQAISSVAGRGFGTNPEFISPDLVGIKLLPNVGRVVLVAQTPRNFHDILCLTMERCTDILLDGGKDPFGVGGWRMHSIGGRFLAPDEVRPPSDPWRKRAARKVRKRLEELN